MGLSTTGLSDSRPVLLLRGFLSLSAFLSRLHPINLALSGTRVRFPGVLLAI
jgi:hypothetical protein